MMTARRSSLLVLLAAVLLAGACSDATGPGSGADANGTWAGSLSHPAYDGGALTLVLTDVNGAVSGTYRLILSKRVGNRASVEQSGGRVEGASANGMLALRLARSSGEDWLLEGRLGGSQLRGEWSTTRGVRGTFEVAQ